MNNNNDVQKNKLGGKAAWYAMLLICLAQAISMMDRQILAILIPRIKADLHVGDAEMGMLYGTVFGVFYALFSLPLGRLADGWKRTKQLGLSIIGWSGMTALGGMASSFALLAISRLGVGVGEASVQPAGFSILSDVFPKKMRGTVGALMASAVAVGLGTAIWFGAGVAAWWDSLYPEGNGLFGLSSWQAAFVMAAIPGIIVGILMLRLPEPQRGLADGIVTKEDPHPFKESFRTFTVTLPGLVWLTMLKDKASTSAWLLNTLGGIAFVVIGVLMTDWTNSLRDVNPVALQLGSLQLGGNAVQWSIIAFGSYVLLSWLQSLYKRDYVAFKLLTSKTIIFMIGLAILQFVINYAIMAWTPAFLMNRFDKTSGEISAVYGGVIMTLGIIGPLIAGPLSDFLQRKWENGRVFVTVFAVTGSSLVVAWVYDADTLDGFYWRFVPYSLILTMWIPPLYASFMDLVLPRMRGTVMSFYMLTTTIFGMGLGPYATGLINDIQGKGLGSALVSLYWVAPLIILFGVLALVNFSHDSKTVVERARAAGEQI